MADLRLALPHEQLLHEVWSSNSSPVKRACGMKKSGVPCGTPDFAIG
ncbi:hypothetical protein HZZ13_22770 [Bradyrhizobium sp. CNPSo 4010]|uniref:Uncharacterized protein n=1 Tax=Bradyrhizobium agreste TaxID=2751811 RepID=A0ABS0PTS9_9BRAD|nr:hypothetical protein [Bradyrhizobium agreste]MBH5400596.1 hypothetical protein [Bradyrhizobium agreste]